MSFLKIRHPKKRDQTVEDYLKTKKNIQQNYLSERLGDVTAHIEFTKLFKPSTESQKEAKEALVKELKQSTETIKTVTGCNNTRFNLSTTSGHCNTRRGRGRRR